MRQYIVNLTNNLIGKYHHDDFYMEFGSSDEFIIWVRLELFANEVSTMSPETLGKILCSFEIEDYKLGNGYNLLTDVIFDNRDFTSNEHKLRELVAICLAYAIRERLKDTPEPRLVPKFERRRLPDSGFKNVIDDLANRRRQS